MNDKIIMAESPEAAEYKTGLSGWVSRGQYFGDGPQAEAAARYHGCTHYVCKYCSAPAPKPYTACEDCRARKEQEKFNAMPRADWDGVAWLYSETMDKYYSCPEDAEDDRPDELTFADLRLVLCTPNHVRQLNSEDCCDELPEDEDEVPPEVQTAMDAFNAAVAGVVLSWSPGRFALRTDKEVK